MARAWVFLLAFGCAAPPEDVDARLEGLIEALGDEDPEVRTLAMSELRRLGPRAEPRLRDHARHPDVEVAARCAELLAVVQGVDTWAKIVTRVRFVDAGDSPFIIIGAGRVEGVAGVRFEICRGAQWIARAEFVEYLDRGEGRSKPRIVAGRAVDVQLEDLAVGY